MNYDDNFFNEEQLLEKEISNHGSSFTLDEKNILANTRSQETAFNDSLSKELETIPNLEQLISQEIITVPEDNQDSIFSNDRTTGNLTLSLDNQNSLTRSQAQGEITELNISNALEYSLDIDGNNKLESSDYSLINLYASFGGDAGIFDIFLQQNGDVLLGEGATRATGEQLTNYLVAAQDSLFDLDGNGKIETSDYSLLGLYSSFGADSQVLDNFLQQNGDVLLDLSENLYTSL